MSFKSIVSLFAVCVCLWSRCIAAFALERTPRNGHGSYQALLLAPGSDDIGVGFDLSLSYGTVSIAYKNGTYVDIAQIEGAAEYGEMMKRLNLESSTHIHRPYRDPMDEHHDQRRQWLRRGRKALGFPASSDVGILSRMVASLRQEVEKHLGHEIKAGVVTWARARACYEEDILDAMEYIRLDSPAIGTQRVLRPWQHEWSTAIDAHQRKIVDGLDNFNDESVVNQPLPHRAILTVLYTRDALQVSFDPELSYYIGRMEGDDYDYYFETDYTLGSDILDNTPRTNHYWSEVRRRILEQTTRWSHTLPITDVVVIGESADSSELQALVGELASGMQAEEPQYHFSDPLYAAARGAAYTQTISDGVMPR